MELRPGMRPIWRKIEEVKRRRRERKLSIVSTAELLRTEESDEIVDDESTRGDAGMEAWQEDEVPGSPKTIATAFAAAEKVKEETTTDDDEKAAKVKEETTTNDDGKETAVEEKETAVEEKETAAAATVTAVPEKKEEEEEEDDDDGEKGRKFGSFAADDELPGSPSFRFWDLARDTEDDLVKFDGTGTRGTDLFFFFPATFLSRDILDPYSGCGIYGNETTLASFSQHFFN